MNLYRRKNSNQARHLKVPPGLFHFSRFLGENIPATGVCSTTAASVPLLRIFKLRIMVMAGSAASLAAPRIMVIGVARAQTHVELPQPTSSIFHISRLYNTQGYKRETYSCFYQWSVFRMSQESFRV
jgi:hypothetical protein